MPHPWAYLLPHERSLRLKLPEPIADRRSVLPSFQAPRHHTSAMPKDAGTTYEDGSVLCDADGRPPCTPPSCVKPSYVKASIYDVDLNSDSPPFELDCH